ncbi:LysR family transcriptional regulator [Stutzerimonas kirkiae]|uniref:LysR family transcriptional regulator n=1 Tax=Stutzerimonas kirkiae TaxID=2211392 RepID=UPI0013F16A96|nr:LysR family transcriptional regulator [Stutzerimonas kirkiae]
MTNPARKSRSKGSDHLELRAIDVFSVVAETGSMTAAALKFSMTQPAVSQILKHLETDVGAPLLDRELRPMRLTPAGEVLFARAQRLLRDAEQLYRELHQVSEAKLQRLRIGLVDSFTSTAGPQLIKALQQDVEQLLVWSGIAPDLRNELVRRDLDLIISPDPIHDVDNIHSRRILKESFVIIVPDSFSQREGSPSLAHLASTLPLVRYSHRSLIGMQIRKHLGRLRIDPPRHLEFDTSDSVVAMVGEGIGWAIVTPLCLLQAPAALSRVKVLPITCAPLSRSLYIAYRNGEFNGMPERIADICERIFDGMLSKLQQVEPWLPQHFQAE